MDGGTLGGPGTVTASTLTFTAGTMGENTSGESGGTTTVTGAATFNGAQAQYLYYGRALNLDGGATWTNAAGGTIGIYTGGESTTSTLSIASGTTFTDQGTTASTGARYLGSNSDGVVSNAGTYLRSYVVSGVQSALGTTNVNAAFNNTGTVEVAGGTLNLQNGGSSTGTLQSDSAATLQFSGGTFNITAGTINNAGTTDVSAGLVTVASGVTYNGSGTLLLSGGTLRVLSGESIAPDVLTLQTGGTLSGPGTVTASTLNFSSGTMGENTSGFTGGTTTVTGTTTFDGTQEENIYYGRTLALDGNSTWTSASGGVIAVYTGGAAATSTLDIANGTTFTDAGTTASGGARYLGYQSDGVISMAGTYVRNGLGTTQVNGTFNNTGSVEINGGTFLVESSGTSSGTWTVGSNGGVEFDSTLYTIDGGSISNSGTFSVAGGTLRISSPLTISGSGGLTMTGGILGGSGTLTASTLNFNGGSLGENTSGFTGGTTNVTGATTFSGAQQESILYGYTLNLNGGATWTSATGGLIQVYTGGIGTSTLNIVSGTTFTDEGTTASSGGRYLGYQSDGVINLAGTYVRNGVGTTQVNGTFNNTGSVEINGGTFLVDSAGASSGTFTVASGAALEFDSSLYTMTGGSITDNGTTSVVGGTLRVSDPLSIGGSGGLTMTGGILGGSGTLTVSTLNFNGGSFGENTSGFTGGTTNVTGATTFSGAQQESIDYGYTLNLNGGATWTSSSGGFIQVYTGGTGTSTLNIASGTTFTDQGTTASTQTRYLGYQSDGVINNAGTYLHAGIGTTQVNGTFKNSGLVEVEQGSMNFVGTTTNESTGTLEATTGGTLIANTGLTNYTSTGGGTLTNGTFFVNGTGGASTIELQVGSETGGEIVNNAANIILDGSNATTSFVDQNGHALLALAANTTSTSGLTIENGYNLTTPAAFSNAGSVTVGTASGDTSTLKIGASGTSAYTQSTAAALTQGTGTIMGNVTVSNGVMAPGSTTTAGTLTITGNYAQSGGTFTDVLGASSNGLLRASGTVSLSGTAALNIVLGSGFVATDGTMYTIMTGSGGLSGQLATGAGGAEFQEDGYNWTLGYSGGNAVLDLINAVGSGPTDVTATWTAGTGAWTTASQWSCSPGPATCVPNNTSNDVYESVLNSPTHTLTLASGNAFAVNTLALTAGTLNIASGASLNLVNQASGLTDIGQGAGLILGGTLTVNGATNGLAQLGSVEGSLQLANGASTATTPASGTLTVSSTGSTDVQQGSTLAVTGNLTNSGAINTGNGASDSGSNSLQVSGALTNASAGSSINLSAAHDSVSATTLSNAGSIGFNAANQSLTTTGSASNSGQLVFNSGSNGSTASIGGAFDNTNTVSMVGASDTLTAGSYTNETGAHTTVGASETVNAGSSLTNNGTLTLNGGTVSTSSLSNNAVIVGGGSLGATNATLTNNSGGSIATSGSGQTLALSGNLTSAGTLSTVAGSTISVTGQAESSGSVSLAGTLSAGNGVTNDSTGTVTLNGGTLAASFSNNGSVAGAGTIGTGPSVDAINGVLGTITPNGTVTFAVNNLTNEGTVNVTSGNTLNFTSNSGSMSNYGSVTVASGATLGLASGMIYSQGSGTTTANGAFGGSAASLTISGGTLQGTGTITGTTNINSGGTLVAGNGSTPGTLTITGELSISGTLGLNASSATNYGVLDVSGALTLNSGSTLNLSNLDALNLAIGKTLTIATSGSAVGGTFTNITGDTYDSGARGWNVLYNQGGDNVELTSISLANLAQPSAATPNPINFGNVRVGATAPSQALTISNQATAPADGLNASISTATAGLTASGSFSGLAPGATDNTSLVVGMNTATAGSRNGTATVALVSNGSTTGSPTTLPSQTINVTGGVYETAQPSLPSSVNLGNFHVGTSSLSQAVAISNPYASGVPAGYQEGLDVASGATAGQATISGGPITNLAAGNSSSSISVGLSGLAAGVNSGTATVGLASDGATTSGLSTLSLGNSTIDVSATGYNLASGQTADAVVSNQRVGGSNTTALNVMNTAPAGSYTEVLNGSFGGTTGAATTNGGAISGGAGAGGIAGGGSNNTLMTVGVNTAAAGAHSGTVTLNYVSNGTGTSGLGNTSVGSQVVNVTGNVYQAAAGQINTAPLSFGVVQVGQAVSQTLSISNIATGPSGYVEDLNASFGSTSGTGASLISGAGSINELTAGSTNASLMTVSVNTSSAGTVNGAIGVNFYTAGTVNGESDGLGVAGVGSASYGVSGTIQTTGTVINDADPVINNSPINLGNTHVGATSPVGLVSLTNQATTAPQASLNASITGNTPITASGTVTDLAPGATDATHLQVGMNTGTAGAISGTATLGLVSDAGPAGCTSNCLLTLASQNVTVTGGVYQYAQPTVASSVNLGNVRVGSTVEGAFAVANTNIAPAGYQEGLDAAYVGGSGTNGASAFGTITNLAAGSASELGASLTAGGAGAQSGTVTIGLTSDGTIDGLSSTTLASQNVTVQATGYRLANPLLAPTAITLNARVGDAAPSTALTVTNSSVDAYTEGLAATLSAATGPFTNNGGAITNLTANAMDSSTLKVGMSTGTSGTFTGTQTVNFTSNGIIDNASAVSVGTGTVHLTGNVYTTAVANVTPTGVNFGIVHVGDTVGTQALTVTNAAAGALNDVLTGGFASVTGPFTGGGSLAGLAAGSMDSSTLQLGMNTSTAGTYSGTATLGLLSHDGALSDVAAVNGSTEVDLTGQVNYHATPTFELSGSGNTGTLTGSGDAFTLNLGTVRSGESLTDLIEFLNGAPGQADALGGSFTDAGTAPGLMLEGFTAVSGLLDGQGETGEAQLNTLGLAAGTSFTDVLSFEGTGSNASGFSEDLTASLTITGEIGSTTTPVPEPDTLLLWLGAGGLLLLIRRVRSARAFRRMRHPEGEAA